MSDGHEYWQVIVEGNADRILTIGWNWVGGRELSDADTATVRKAAHHLLAFIGDPAVEPRKCWVCGYLLDDSAKDCINCNPPLGTS